MKCIYKITSPNNKVYIGKTKNFERRYNEYSKLWCKNQKLLYNSFKIYGFEKHTFEIIEKIDDNVILSEREVYWIEFYKSNKSKYITENGLNLTDGGDGVSGNRWVIDSKNKLSKSKTGSNHWNYGKKVSDDVKLKISKSKIGSNVSIIAKRKISASLTGVKNHMYGKKHNEHSKKIMSDSKLGEKNNRFGTKHSLETLEKMRNIKYKKIEAFIFDTNESVGIFHGVKICAEYLKINSANISLVLNGKRNKVSGYTFKFV